MDMTYQQAHAIKKRSFSELMAMNIASGGSITGSLGRTIAQKTKARATRFKEKFDPLNIAKFMTGGSRLGPAMLGRLLGRSQRDIEYFSGVRARPISGGKYTKIGKVEEQSDLMPVLEKIYSFLKKTNEQDIKRKELTKNFEEENKLEDERRHQELIKAITGKETATVVKKKEGETGGMFGDILKTVKDMIDTAINGFQFLVQKMINGALKSFNFLKNSGPLLMNILRFFTTNPIGLGLLAGATLLSLLYNDKKPEDTTKGILNAPNDAAIAQEIEKQQKENIPPEQIELKNKIKKALMKDAPFATRVYDVGGREYLNKIGVPEKEVNDLYDDTKPPKVPEILKEINPEAYSEFKNIPVKLPSEVTSPVSQEKAAVVRSDFAAGDPRRLDLPQGAAFGVKPKGIKSAPVSAPKSNLNNVIQDNQNLKLEDKIGKAVESSVNNTNVSSLTTSPPQKRRIPSVRNMEETFQRMIYNSTRVV